MGKFDAATAVEDLEYDFTKYGAGSGTIVEPSSGQVNGFFRGLRDIISEIRGLQTLAGDLDEDTSPEELAEKMGQVEEASEGASRLQQRTMELIAEMCGATWQEVPDPDPGDLAEGDKPPTIKALVGGEPSFDQLEKLPFRVLQAFNQWLMGEIAPKKTTRELARSPQDRRRPTT